MSLDDHMHIPEITCLHCGHKANCVAGINGEHRPSDGDFTFCIRCAHVMCFTDDLGVRELTAEEFVRAQENPILQLMLRQVRHVNTIFERVKLAANAGNN